MTTTSTQGAAVAAARPISPSAVELVKEFEGLYLLAYRCPAGVLTIGYGHTGPDVRAGQTITAAQAERFLRDDLGRAAADVDRLVRVPLSDDQRGALASFVFNVGAGAFAKSTLLRKLNAGDYAAVPAELARWTKGGGRVLPGLVRRRAAEGALFVGGDDSHRMPQAVEPIPAAKPITESRTIRGAQAGAGVAAATAAVSGLPALLDGVAPLLDQAETIGAAARRFASLLPVGPAAAGWVVSAVLAVALGYCVYRKIADTREGQR